MTTPIFKKVGRRYVKIGDYDDAQMYYPHGATLVWARPGSTLTKYGIEPADAAMLASAERMRDAMMEAMRTADRMTPDQKMSKTEQKAWAAYKAIAGERSSLRLKGPSMHDVVDAGIKALTEAVRKP
jgi:hypothetical protein